MSILDRTVDQSTRMMRPSRVAPAVIEQATGQINDRDFAVKREYAISLTVVVKYWTNEVMRDSQRAIARKALLAELYRDALRHCARIKHAVASEDFHEAVEAVQALEKEMTE